MTSTFDVLIIGGGYAGLSAASSIQRQAHSVLILDSGAYRNDAAAHMHTVPTWDHRKPAEFRAAAHDDFKRYGVVQVRTGEAETAKQDDAGCFVVRTTAGDEYTGRKLVLASGMEDVMPAEIPGYAESWGRGIFHCLYCHGWEEKGAESSGMLAYGDTAAVPVALHFARQGLRLSDKVTIYTNGNAQLGDDLGPALGQAASRVSVDTRRIASVSRPGTAAQIVLHFEDGTSATEAFITHKPKAQRRGTLAEQLGLQLTPGGTVLVNPPFNQTSLRGVFAAGDLSSPMPTITAALMAGTAAGGGAPLQLQADEFGHKSLF